MCVAAFTYLTFLVFYSKACLSCFLCPIAAPARETDCFGHQSRTRNSFAGTASMTLSTKGSMILSLGCSVRPSAPIRGGYPDFCWLSHLLPVQQNDQFLPILGRPARERSSRYRSQKAHRSGPSSKVTGTAIREVWPWVWDYRWSRSSQPDEDIFQIFCWSSNCALHLHRQKK